MTLITIALGLLAWYTLGCVILALGDDDHQSLFMRARRAPAALYIPTVLAWPIVLWFWRRKENKG